MKERMINRRARSTGSSVRPFASLNSSRANGVSRSASISAPPPLGVPQNHEQVHHIAVEIVIDLGIDRLLAQQDRRRPAERLDVDLVRRQVRQHPRRQLPLAAMPAQNGT
jgi:hypothetical protein